MGDFAWLPAASAPYDQDLELSVIDWAEVHVLVFPCRRTLGGWVDAETGTKVAVNPTHWRPWRPPDWAG